MPKIRLATIEDFPALLALEEACYDEARRSSKWTLRNSLRSSHQEVWVRGNPIHATLVLWRHRDALRIYNVAVHPDFEGQGIGRTLLALTEERARALGAVKVTLEAAAALKDLVRWYEHHGYRIVRTRTDYYGPSKHAVRMEKLLNAGAP